MRRAILAAAWAVVLLVIAAGLGWVWAWALVGWVPPVPQPEALAGAIVYTLAVGLGVLVVTYET